MDELVRRRDEYTPPFTRINSTLNRTNLMVQFVNSQIRLGARYCQIQPKMNHHGEFPPEFRVPKTVDEVRAMDRA